ncbi:TRAF3-interacting protein 1 isoform X3 [Pantherophis guttatus]|uniref:TRAF3-interacting protein 1 isoform X3 n=1 Tax=Pantherophis guttatus TaxID=94885 RepID=A0ABM3YQH9_PANGU|nr:TRAF3-interacting protein 1 isoform X3 [Pantherophis guttatus]
MQGSVIRRTQELLGRVIRKPPLTERLLSKPPFRYLHDVIREVIRATGFMKGLYTEAEMKSDVKDKDAKIIFLQKAIDVVIMVTGEYLAVKPARVVAGHEPERTNEFLQAIAKCCLNKPTGSEENIAKKLAEKSINKDQAEFDKENENSARLSKQHATKGPRQRNKTSSEGESFGDAEGDVLNAGTTEKISENNEFTNEIPSQITQRRLPRPSSARPAPPRIKRQQSTEILIPERNGSAKMVSSVIIDKEEEEDDQFIVKAEQQLPEIAELKMEATVELEGDEKHGSLVQRILETKKDYELSQLQKSAEKEKPLLSEAAKRKEKDLVTKEIEKFCGSIQALCRSALPLGKIMDYIQEDVDAMKNELQTWQNENKELEETLQKEQGITDGVVEPLKIELTELDQLIKDEEDKIYTKRANVLRNNEKIQKMVHIINSRR